MAQVTPKLIEMVREMRDGGWWQVTTNLDRRFVSRPVSPSVANRLVKLGWAEKETQWSLDGRTYRVYVWLNETGKRRAVEFDQMSEANAQ